MLIQPLPSASPRAKRAKDGACDRKRRSTVYSSRFNSSRFACRCLQKVRHAHLSSSNLRSCRLNNPSRFSIPTSHAPRLRQEAKCL